MGTMTGKHWHGWTWSEEKDCLIDEYGNHYHQGEIRALFYLRQWHGSQKEGLDKKKIRFLRDVLDEKIKEAEKRNQISIQINWGDRQETLLHPSIRRPQKN